MFILNSITNIIKLETDAAYIALCLSLLYTLGNCLAENRYRLRTFGKIYNICSVIINTGLILIQEWRFFLWFNLITVAIAPYLNVINEFERVDLVSDKGKLLLHYSQTYTCIFCAYGIIYVLNVIKL